MFARPTEFSVTCIYIVTLPTILSEKSWFCRYVISIKIYSYHWFVLFVQNMSILLIRIRQVLNKWVLICFVCVRIDGIFFSLNATQLSIPRLWKWRIVLSLSFFISLSLSLSPVSLFLSLYFPFNGPYFSVKYQVKPWYMNLF